MRVDSDSLAAQPVAWSSRSASGTPRLGDSFAAVLGERQGPPPDHRVAPPRRPGTMTGLLARATDAGRGIDRLIDAAARGQTFTPGQLLALQAGVARYGQTIEVVSRGADRVVAAFKQTVATQI